MMTFNNLDTWIKNARLINTRIEVLPTDSEDPFVHHIAYLNGKQWGYFCDEFGWLCEHNKDSQSMSDELSEWYIYNPRSMNRFV